VHLLHGIIQNNTAKWFSKGLNNKQWLEIPQMIEDEGPMSFVRKVE
jgi:hypothetical protein